MPNLLHCGYYLEDNIADILVQTLKKRIRAHVSLYQLQDPVFSEARRTEPLLVCMLFCASPFRRSVACQRGTGGFKGLAYAARGVEAVVVVFVMGCTVCVEYSIAAGVIYSA